MEKLTPTEFTQALNITTMLVWWALNWETDDFYQAFKESGHSEGYHWKIFCECKKEPLEFFCKLDVYNRRLMLDYLYTVRFKDALPILNAQHSQLENPPDEKLYY